MYTPPKDFVFSSAADYPQDSAEMFALAYRMFPPEEVRRHLNELLNHFLTSNEIEGQTGSQRNEKIIFCEVMWFASQAQENAIEDLRLAKHVKAGK